MVSSRYSSRQPYGEWLKRQVATMAHLLAGSLRPRPRVRSIG
ncbi:hypothetical protein HaLaN_13807, partial [Haematococcus lacustris]